MKIIFLSIGKQHDVNLRNGIEDFTKRADKYFTVEWQLITSVKNAAALNEFDLKKAEAEVILSHILKEDYLILLDEKGKMLSSVQLANLIQQKANESSKRLIFLIGGAFGVHETIFKRANLIWSLSTLVFPHMLVRLILSEQVYRACTIIRNEKYHHL
jgi:23S rRNA (pseudouridine1915-N3)-methyltransferase